ncbi:hypothetical protein B7R22_07085 [Subtercola boreus]|uniref:Uncharacterized protein n=1 Tax=Subtercola boreus TaxID=120213 RepID=A0A3E0W011_9MICO|nr:hypothetical protein [Subtercola boreus]RFA15089.1 hypothetical protein B7R22_07085 [Subtercola boreus]
MTDSNGRPDGSPDLAPDSSYEVPVVTASLSRRALRERLAASSVPPVVASRRERRERELAGEAPVVPVAVVGPVEPIVVGDAEPTVPSARRARRDIRGLEHLLLAPVGQPLPVDEPAAEVETEPQPAAAAEPDVAAEPVAPAPEPIAAPALAATAEPRAAAAPAAATLAPAAATLAPAAAAPAATPEPATIHFDTEDLPEAHATSVHTMTFSHADEDAPVARVSATTPPRASAAVDASGPPRRTMPRIRRAGTTPRPGARKRTIASTVVMVATAGLVATSALPAYAYTYTDNPMGANRQAVSDLGIQSLTVSGVNGQASSRDDYSTTGNVAEMDSTTGTTVSPTVQALAAELMADVASGKLVGSVPDHIVEIRNLANGVAVPGCGVDYRVLQTIKVAVDNFDKVGVSDINRHCTGQIEGAGTASSHYKDGGGHAVDFYILNGHGLTGADSDSLKLIRLLDPLVPKGSGLGQSGCRPSIAVSNFAPFPDTCTHMHVDFGNAQGVALKS